jgi:anti-sigma-K factor RskA
MTDSDVPDVPDPRDRDDLDALIAAYALDAVSDEERAFVEARLATSPELRAELAAHRGAAAVLGDAAPPVEPPPSLKASIFDRLDGTPQLSATEAREPGTSAAGPVAASAHPETTDVPAESLLPLPAEPLAPIAPPPPATPADAASGAAAGPVELAARRRWFQRPAAIVGAAAAAVLLIAGAVVGVNWSGPSGWGAQREVQAIAAAPDAQATTVEPTTGGEVTVVWSEQLGLSAVRASDLPDVGAESTYELWYIDESGARPAGTFDPRDGDAYVVLDGTFTEGVVVGMTVEPAGGSPAPTTDPIVVVET